MKIEPTAFLAIERSLASALRSQWDKRARELAAELQPLIDAKKWGEAQTVVNRLTLDGVVSGVKRQIEELAVSALLFGAHHAAGSVNDTGLAKGKPLPKEMDGAIAQLEYMVEADGRDYVCTQLHLAIEALKRADAASHFQKGDLTGAQLAETGGLLEPEQAGATKTLYVNRPLLNGLALIAWAKENGFETCLPEDDMHVTVCYSKTAVDWSKFTPDTETITVEGGTRHVRQFGDASVLVFCSPEIEDRHQDFMLGGASHDYDEYNPHVTISYGDVDLKKLSFAYDGPLVFGPEEFKPVKKDWAADIVEKADEQSLADKLNEAVMNGGTEPIDLGAQLTTSRLVSLGFLAQAVDQAVTTYQVNEVLDGRTCPVCQYMHGKTFSVQPQYDRLVQSLSTSDPAALKDLMPWPDQSASGLADLQSLSPEELQAQGYASPPYHPGCRGMLMLVGSVEVPADTTTEAPIETQFDPTQLSDFHEENAALSLDAVPLSETAGTWTPGALEQLNWEKFDVTDPKAFEQVDDAIAAGDYDTAQQLIADWKAEHLEKEEPNEFDGPNAAKKKRKLQVAACREQDYTDIRPDISSIAFETGVQNDMNAPLDRS